MNKLIYCILVFFICCLPAFSQTTLIWEKTYGGSEFEQPFGSEPTADGGIILGGHSLSTDGDITSNYGDYDWWVLKINDAGNIVWQKSYGGSEYDKCRYATENPDGTSLAFGSVKSNDHDVTGNHTPGENDYWLLKLDATGNIIWSKCYGGSQEEGGRSVIRALDGNYLVAGYTHSSDGDVSFRYGGYDVWLVKVNAADGSVIWEKSYGGTKDERVRSIAQWPNGDFVYSGNTESVNYDLGGTTNNGDEDVLISRIDSTGHLVWAKQYGGPGKDRAYYCTRDLDGNVLVAGKDSANGGNVTGNHGESDVWVMKLNFSDGSLIWQKSFGGTLDDEGFRIDPTFDGGYIIGATSESSDGDSPGNRGHSDYWFIKVDSNLNIEWTRTDGGPGYDHLNDLVVKDDGTFVGIGFSNSDPGENSEITYNHGTFDTYLMRISFCDAAVSIIEGDTVLICGSGGSILTSPKAEAYLWSTGETTQTISVSTAGNYTVKITQAKGTCVQTSLPTTVIADDFKMYPNPASDRVSIIFDTPATDSASFTFYDWSGRSVYQQNLVFTTGTHSEMSIPYILQGMYIVEMSHKDCALRKKFFKR